MNRIYGEATDRILEARAEEHWRLKTLSIWLWAKRILLLYLFVGLVLPTIVGLIVWSILR